MVETVNAQLLPASQAGGTVSKNLEPGTELRAKVEANLPNGVVRLATAGAKIDLKVPAPLPVGGDVTVTVSGSKAQPAVQITTTQPSGNPVPSNPTQGSSNPVSSPSTDTAKPPLPGNTSTPAPQAASGGQSLARSAPVLTQLLQSGGPLPSGAVQIGAVLSGNTQQLPATGTQIPLQTGGTGPLPAGGGLANLQLPAGGQPLTNPQPAGSLQSTPNPAGSGAGAGASANAGQVASPSALPLGASPASAPAAPNGVPTGTAGNPTTAASGSALQTVSPGGGANSSSPAVQGTPSGAQALPAGSGQPGVPASQAQVMASTSGALPPGALPANRPSTGPAAATVQARAGAAAGPLPSVAATAAGPASSANPASPSVAQATTAPTSAQGLPSGDPSTRVSPVPLQTQAGPAGSVQQAANLYPHQANQVSSPTMTVPATSTGAASALEQAAAIVRQPLAEQQAGMGALFAQIGSLAAAQATGKVSLPDPVQKAMQQIMGLRVGANQPVTGKAIQQAVAQSGPFREAGLAQLGGQGPGQSAGPSAGQAGLPDLKTTLLMFRSVLQAFGAKADVLKPAQQPPVPSKTGAPQGQAQHVASGFWAGAMQQNLQKLLQDTDAALARMRLTQLVNSGLAGDENPQASSSRPMDTVLELPLALGQETSVLQMQIGRDGDGQGEDAEDETAWRLKFALDLTATGPLEASVSLRGGSTYVSLWVDRPETHEALNGMRATMEASFADAGLDLQELRLIRGLPPKTVAKYGALIDRRS